MSTKDYSSKQEKMISDFLGWRTVSGSGARPLHPGDVISNEFLGECKTHTEIKDDIIFKFNHWKKIQEEAVSQFKSSVLFVDDGSQTILNTWCLFNRLPSKDFILKDIPVKHNKSIRLNKKYMKDKCIDILDNEKEENWSSQIVFRVEDWNCYLCSLSDFSYFFGEENA